MGNHVLFIFQLFLFSEPWLELSVYRPLTKWKEIWTATLTYRIDLGFFLLKSKHIYRLNNLYGSMVASFSVYTSPRKWRHLTHLTLLDLHIRYVTVPKIKTVFRTLGCTSLTLFYKENKQGKPISCEWGGHYCERSWFIWSYSGKYCCYP